MCYRHFKAYLTTPVSLEAAQSNKHCGSHRCKDNAFSCFLRFVSILFLNPPHADWQSYNIQLNIDHVLSQVNKSTFRKASGITKVIYQDNMATPPHNFATAAGCLSHHGSNLFIDCKII